MDKNNLFDCIPEFLNDEVFDVIVKSKNIKVERILSKGQRTPIGEWYDQNMNELVVLLRGRANILFEEDYNLTELKPGDYINIPAHVKHRVEWTDENALTVWLTIHYT